MTKDELETKLIAYKQGFIGISRMMYEFDLYTSALLKQCNVSGRSEQFFCWDEEALGKESRCKSECDICKNKGE